MVRLVNRHFTAVVRWRPWRTHQQYFATATLDWLFFMQRRPAETSGDPQTSETAGQEGEVLQIGNLESVQPGTAGIHGLSDCALCSRRASSTAEGPSGDINKLVRHDGFGQILVEIARGDDSEGVQVMLEEHVDIIRGFG